MQELGKAIHMHPYVGAAPQAKPATGWGSYAVHGGESTRSSGSRTEVERKAAAPAEYPTGARGSGPKGCLRAGIC